ncbi:serine/threonine protein kinase [candidate division KSB1 bacterium]|nr:serine/threonine protein kinase [candidate division KSB1 bacterium]
MKKIGKFKIIEEIGKGGMGIVYKALDPFIDREVAIKVIIEKELGLPEVKERFHREARSAGKLSHENITIVHEVGEVEGKPYIVMEYLRGRNLSELISKKKPIELNQKISYAIQICKALKVAHANKIIHRDIKPSNLILTSNQESCYLVDFGISLTSQDISRLTNSSRAVGTPGYMSPEQEANEELDCSSDIFSLGIVLYEVLCGTRPTVGEYKPLNAQNEAIPPSIDNLIRDSITSQSSRIQTAEEFFNRLQKALRPSSNIGATFSQGALHEIIASLKTFNHISFASLPPGQRILLMTRLKTLLTASEFHLRNPIALFLNALLKVCGRMEEENFKLIAENSLIYGFEMKYGDTWFGNISLREDLSDLAFTCEQRQHRILSEETLNFLSDKDLTSKEPWFLFDTRNIVQNLLANDLCDDDTASKLGPKLEEVLTECYSERITNYRQH